LQWLQEPSKINGDNLNNIRSEASRHFRNKMMEYLRDKIDELAKNSKNKNIRDLYRGINEFNMLIKICLNETYSKVHIGNHFSDNFLSRMV
jgi:hypothetical protein